MKVIFMVYAYRMKLEGNHTTQILYIKKRIKDNYLDKNGYLRIMRVFVFYDCTEILLLLSF